MATPPPRGDDHAARPWHDPAPQAACCTVRQPLLRAAGLGVDYAGIPALRGVDLDINAGCITAVVGPSGCGKSTFLHTLNRMTDLIPRTRVHGELRLQGVSLLDPAADTLALRRRIGMIAQRPNPFPLSIRRNITFPLGEHGIRRREAREQVLEECLRRVGLWPEVKDRLDRPALDLSGGQQQRLCLARALALDPEVLLLDEPCSALDPMASAVIEDLITDLRGAYTVVVVTHNLAQARRIADDLAVFWVRDGAGELVEAGPADQVFTAPRTAVTRDYITGARG